MMRRILLACLAVVTLSAGAAIAQSSRSSGGVFNTLDNQVIQGAWTWLGASPLVFEGATNDGVTTTLAVTDPTVARTLTLPNATDTLVGKATTDTLTNKTLTTPTITAPVIATVTNTGTLTLPSATGGVPVILDCGATGTGTRPTSSTGFARGSNRDQEHSGL